MIIEEYSNLKVSIIISGTESEFATDYSDGPKLFKYNGIGILYSKLSNQSYYDLGYISQEKDLQLGDAYIIENKKYVKVKTPICNI